MAGMVAVLRRGVVLLVLLGAVTPSWHFPLHSEQGSGGGRGGGEDVLGVMTLHKLSRHQQRGAMCNDGTPAAFYHAAAADSAHSKDWILCEDSLPHPSQRCTFSEEA